MMMRAGNCSRSETKSTVARSSHTVDDAAGFVLHVHENEDVRILPLDGGDDPIELHGLLRVLYLDVKDDYLQELIERKPLALVKASRFTVQPV
jgi:hypothetical protein